MTFRVLLRTEVDVVELPRTPLSTYISRVCGSLAVAGAETLGGALPCWSDVTSKPDASRTSTQGDFNLLHFDAACFLSMPQMVQSLS